MTYEPDGEPERDWHQEWKDDQMQRPMEEPPEDYNHEFDENGEHDATTCRECVLINEAADLARSRVGPADPGPGWDSDAGTPGLPHTEGAIPGVCGYCGRWYPMFAADGEICADRTRDAARSATAPFPPF